MPGTVLCILKTLPHVLFIWALAMCGQCGYLPYSEMRSHGTGQLHNVAKAKKLVVCLGAVP